MFGLSLNRRPHSLFLSSRDSFETDVSPAFHLAPFAFMAFCISPSSRACSGVNPAFAVDKDPYANSRTTEIVKIATFTQILRDIISPFLSLPKNACKLSKPYISG
jgi:hypothetical protein